MIGGIILLAIAAIGVSYAGLVIKAAKRRDNMLFGALAFLDAAMTAWRGVNVLAGDRIIDTAVLLPCSIGTIAMAIVTLEFLASFPNRPPLRWRWRCLLLAWAAIGMTVVLTVDRSRDWSSALSELVFFGPAALLVFIVGGSAWRRTRDRDARTVIAMLWFRWAFGWGAYFLGPRLGIFEGALWAETTFATLTSFVVIGTAVLRTELFSIRSSSAEAVVVSTIGFIVVVGGGSAVRAILGATEPGSVQDALLTGATLVPLALAGIGWMLYPRLEKRVLAPLDQRRARRLDVQDEPLPVEATTAVAEAIRRIAAIADGATVRWQLAGTLAPDVVERLRAGAPLMKSKRDASIELPACFIVPALAADGSPLGAFLVDDGLVDRDTYLVARDLAARVALVVERAQAVAALEDARRLAALGQFAAAIAHDIRTPLTSISLNIQILQRKLALSEDDAEHFDIALEELRRLDRSVAEILDFAKPVRLVTEAIDVGDLVETAARNLGPVLTDKGMSLRCETADKSSSSVQGDAQRLRQVLVNLVDNAADASQPGAEVTLRTTRPDDTHVAIEIVDRGSGIGIDDLAHIFEPFFTTRPDGTGLGLAICHKVVTAHGGELRVRSRVGEGSTFTVVLPATHL